MVHWQCQPAGAAQCALKSASNMGSCPASSGPAAQRTCILVQALCFQHIAIGSICLRQPRRVACGSGRAMSQQCWSCIAWLEITRCLQHALQTMRLLAGLLEHLPSYRRAAAGPQLPPPCCSCSSWRSRPLSRASSSAAAKQGNGGAGGS